MKRGSETIAVFVTPGPRLGTATPMLRTVIADVEPQEREHDMMTVDEVADFLRCSPQGVIKAIEDGRLPGYRCGTARGRLLVKRADLHAFLKPARGLR